jgi:transcriptional regulator with XRE-family HTH domain
VNVTAVPPYRFPKTIFSDLGGKVIVALRKARRDARLTQVQAAEKLGCRQTFLSKIECGERRIDVAEFAKICDAYGVAPGRLLDSLVNATRAKARSSRARRKRPR